MEQQILDILQDWGGVISLIVTAIFGIFGLKIRAILKELGEALVVSKALMTDTEKTISDLQAAFSDNQMTPDEMKALGKDVSEALGKLKSAIQEWKDFIGAISNAFRK